MQTFSLPQICGKWKHLTCSCSLTWKSKHQRRPVCIEVRIKYFLLQHQPKHLNIKVREKLLRCLNKRLHVFSICEWSSTPRYLVNWHKTSSSCLVWRLDHHHESTVTVWVTNVLCVTSVHEKNNWWRKWVRLHRKEPVSFLGDLAIDELPRGRSADYVQPPAGKGCNGAWCTFYILPHFLFSIYHSSSKIRGVYLERWSTVQVGDLCPMRCIGI